MSENVAVDLDNSPSVSLPKQGMSGCAIAGYGCGGLLVLMLIAAGIGGWWLKNHGLQFGTDFVISSMKDGLKEMDIPEDQMNRIEARMDEIGTQVKSGELGQEDVARIFNAIAKSPLMSGGMSLFLRRAYVDESGLSDEEKADAAVQARRYVRGVIDGLIPRATQDSVLDRISTEHSDGNREFKQKLTDEELRELIAVLKTASDAASIPEDVPKINMADEFDKAVDSALSNK